MPECIQDESKVLNLPETIAAVATPLGEGGIGIVRISGPEALDVLRRLFRPLRKNVRFAVRRMYLGHVVDAKGERVDQVLAVYMRAPKTYTGEDVVEIHAHGGAYVVREILRLALMNGARLAEPGEFTRRAFLSGKLDLVQAEAVIDLIRASADRAAKQAARHLDGELSARIAGFREEILVMLSQIAASVDFPEHDIPELHPATIQVRLSGLANAIGELLSTSVAGRLLREGLRVVIAGRPNVGKSSLLNALLGRERAIVTEFAGTTRDIVDDVVAMGGVPVRLMDTAGLHAAADPVEQIGVDRAKRAIAEADLTLIVLDQSSRLQPADRDALAQCAEQPHLVVCNKSDLPPAFDAARLLTDQVVLRVSAHSGAGLELLRQAIVDRVLGQQLTEDSLLVANARQAAALRQAAAALRAARQAVDDGLPLDLLSVDLQGALDSLGAILGQTVDGDIVAEIFGRFCIGK